MLESVRRLSHKIKCKLGFHHTAGVQMLWSRDNPNYGGTRLRCTWCDKIIKEEIYD
ncbi:hypothetical protein LCGC14_0392600 [marine sediment metagenome]|uniref:Uncharacterized protein n=1 Tax=marine sediment metagenome TaxID=412755 RepID=A0A0F9T4S3_9ZZZZ